MPNWCDNNVILKHSDPKKIADLKAHLESNSEGKSEYFFNYLRPRPEIEKDNWYLWNIENWGCKWDSEPSVFEIDENNISLDFASPWSPPIALYEYLTAEGWDVEALYSEPGCAFCGAFTNGEDDCYSYDIEDPESYSDIPDEIFNYAGIDIMLEEFKQQEEDSE